MRIWGILFLIFLATTLIIRFLALILRMKEQALAFSVSQLAPKFLILVLVFVVIASGLPANTTSLVFAYTAAQVLTVVLLIYQLRQDLQAVSHAKWSSELHRDGLRYGLPLAFGNLAYWGLTSIDRFVLKNISGLDELGYLFDGGQLWRRRPDFPKCVFHYLGAFGVQMGRRKNQSG